MSVTVNGTNGLTFNDGSSQQTAASGFGFKNRLINGAMMIDQRNAGASVTLTTGAYTLDRWVAVLTQASKFSVQQNAGSVTPPSGFTNYLGATSLSAYSTGASDAFGVRQIIEGLNISDLGWGTANAQPITISFWVRSSLTGTFGLGLGNNGVTRAYAASYTISSANTWTYVTVTVPGDTSGTWLTNNGIGLYLTWSLGYGSSYLGAPNTWNAGSYFMPTGSVSVVGTNGATFYITGVQVEKGSTATSFDYRPYGTELALCQRYYQISGASTAVTYPSDQTITAQTVEFKVSMRAGPTLGVLSGAQFHRPGIAFYSVNNYAGTPSTDGNGVMNGYISTGAGTTTVGQITGPTLSAEL